jgi:hypothetical protein
MGLSPRDHEALRRALAAAQGRGEDKRQQIGFMLGDGDWQAAAEFASCSVQREALRLKPWQLAPCEVDAGDVDAPGYEHRRTAQAAKLLRRLLAAGLSRWEPDPLGALNEADSRGQ